MGRLASALVLSLLVLQEAADAASEKARLHDALAASAESAGEQLIKLKAWDEARAFLELVRAKSDARAEALDKLIAKTDKQTSGLKWDAKSSELIKAFGADQSKPFQAFAKAWKEKDPEAARWTEAEGQILGDLLDYVKAYARLTQIRAHYELPKTRFDWKLSVPAVWHAGYKHKNPGDSREIEGKTGFTKEGQASAKRSITSGVESLSELLESVIHAPFYRTYILHPNLHFVGMGQERSGTSACSIDVDSGRINKLSVPSQLLVPRNNEKGVALTGYDDYEALIAGKTMRELGYPISLILFDNKTHPKDVSATLSLNMKSVDFYLSTPEQPIGSKPPPTHKYTILLVPKHPLQPQAEYKVTLKFTADGSEQLLEWTFRTAR